MRGRNRFLFLAGGLFQINADVIAAKSRDSHAPQRLQIADRLRRTVTEIILRRVAPWGVRSAHGCGTRHETRACEDRHHARRRPFDDDDLMTLLAGLRSRLAIFVYRSRSDMHSPSCPSRLAITP